MKLQELKKPEVLKSAIAVMLILIACVYLFSHWRVLWGRPTSNAVAFYQVFRPAGVNSYRPVSAANPANPSSKFATLTYKFADTRGAVDVIEYPHDATHALEVRVEHLQKRGRPPWLGQVQAVSNPARQALLFAALRGPWLMRRWLLDAHLRPTQMNAVNQARQEFQSSMAMLAQSQQQGLIDADLLRRIKESLQKFLTMSGAVSKAGPKRQAARQVMTLARRYAAEIEKRRAQVVSAYINKIIGRLSVQEKEALAARIAPIMRRWQ
ncbi:MAG: hypothetical protein ACP5I8_05340 [Phycisphaerae bacterium]